MKLQRFSGKLKKRRNLLVVRRVVGDSMLPTLKPGAIIVATRWLRLRVGSVVVVSHNGTDKVKRIATITSDGVFVVGDNQAHSTDSRQFGFVSHGTVRGVVRWPRC